MTSASGSGTARVPAVLCTGIAVLDQIFRVDSFPTPEAKTRASEFVTVNGGCTANAAIAIARLGGRSRFAGPLGGPAGADTVGDQIVAGLARENVGHRGCARVDGARSPVSAILVDARGERVIVNYRDERLSATRPADPADLAATIDVLLADNRFPDFVLPICRAAHARGIPVVLDVDGPSDATADLLGVASHVLFSAEGLRAAAGSDDLAAGLALMGAASKAFLAVTDGGNDMLWFADGKICRTAPFAIEAVDTLAAGDVFHGAFALALADSGDPVAAMRFAAAVAAVKCTRFGGVSGAPHRRDIEAFLGRPTRT